MMQMNVLNYISTKRLLLSGYTLQPPGKTVTGSMPGGLGRISHVQHIYSIYCMYKYNVIFYIVARFLSPDVGMSVCLSHLCVFLR